MKKGQTGSVFSSGTVLKWDPHRELLWQQGLGIATSFYDPTNKKGYSLHCPQSDRDVKGINCMLFRGTFIQGNPAEKGFWFHPNNKDYMFMQTGSTFIKVHLPSGTDIIHSR